MTGAGTVKRPFNSCTFTTYTLQPQSDSIRAVAEHDIFIKAADKGRATVVRHVDKCISEANRHLSYTEQSMKLQLDHTKDYTSHITCILRSLYSRQLIIRNDLECLTPRNTNSDWFCLLFKIQKVNPNQLRTTDIPGGAVVSNCSPRRNAANSLTTTWNLSPQYCLDMCTSYTTSSKNHKGLNSPNTFDSCSTFANPNVMSLYCAPTYHIAAASIWPVYMARFNTSKDPEAYLALINLIL